MESKQLDPFVCVFEVERKFVVCSNLMMQEESCYVLSIGTNWLIFKSAFRGVASADLSRRFQIYFVKACFRFDQNAKSTVRRERRQHSQNTRAAHRIIRTLILPLSHLITTLQLLDGATSRCRRVVWSPPSVESAEVDCCGSALQSARRLPACGMPIFAMSRAFALKWFVVVEYAVFSNLK